MIGCIYGKGCDRRGDSDSGRGEDCGLGGVSDIGRNFRDQDGYDICSLATKGWIVWRKEVRSVFLVKCSIFSHNLADEFEVGLRDRCSFRSQLQRAMACLVRLITIFLVNILPVYSWMHSFPLLWREIAPCLINWIFLLSKVPKV